MKTSAFFRLDVQDFLKAFLLAVVTPVLVVIQQSVEAGSLTIDWKHCAMIAIGAAIAYLIKNLLTPATIVSKVQADAQNVTNKI